MTQDLERPLTAAGTPSEELRYQMLFENLVRRERTILDLTPHEDLGRNRGLHEELAAGRPAWGAREVIP